LIGGSFFAGNDTGIVTGKNFQQSLASRPI
jgi:hypothetical protein